ncbi:hypothetical protein GUJ93_ZPchr0012g19500 [Zizania palustris]|uniref:Uncharacterized protein n=1 Tax=Zizania palustris TaxID=103762 RepID=A0A8J5WMJ7_ZIZPA|nr:hypothetical protein GUJ93_ZPchr0012g19500 [Zizania palustris]
MTRAGKERMDDQSHLPNLQEGKKKTEYPSKRSARGPSCKGMGREYISFSPYLTGYAIQICETVTGHESGHLSMDEACSHQLLTQ